MQPSHHDVHPQLIQPQQQHTVWLRLLALLPRLALLALVLVALLLLLLHVIVLLLLAGKHVCFKLVARPLKSTAVTPNMASKQEQQAGQVSGAGGGSSNSRWCWSTYEV